jgi:HK97 family phage portal protein
MVASLPLQQYRKVGGGKPVKLATSPLLDNPSAYGTIYDWLHQAMVSLVLHGNAWGFITGRDGYGYPTSIEWLPPERVTVQDDEQQPWNPMRAKVYFYGRVMSRDEIFHIRAFSVPGKLAGLSPLQLFISLIGSGQDALEYGASWYRAGGWPPGTFQNSETEVEPDQADEIRRRLTNSIKRREPLVYGRDWDYKPVSVPPSEAQFIEAMQLNATQIAAILGLPPERIGGKRGDSLTYSTTEMESISLITDTLRPWLVRIETALFDILPVNQYVRFNSDAMLKVTTEERHKIYQLDRDIGLKTVNEIRDLEELEPLAAGIGTDPLPLQVLVAMARGIKEIPASFEKLVIESPADALQREQALVLAKEAAANPAAPVPPVYPEPAVKAPAPASPQAQNGKTAAMNGSGHG